MQDQEESKNQEIQEKQEQEDKGAMTKLQDVFNLAHDQAHPDKIDATIRANTRVSGTNMWVLMFAIAVASIGLNVNSTAVVIGAMLISPLMGPIVGMGYGLAVGDTALIRQAVRNIIIFVVISLITATLYFLLTPLKEAQSELLARTQPTLWDVLIAFFGAAQAAAQGVGNGIQTPVAKYHDYCCRVGCDDSERLYGIRTGAPGTVQHKSQCRDHRRAAAGKFFCSS